MVVGIDEVGRGCWAGPLVAGAVMLDKPIAGLKDSKALTKASRGKLAEQIKQEAVAIGLGWVSAQEVDALGLTESVRLAMRRALDQVATLYDEIIIDGNYDFFPDNPKSRSVIKADATVPAVSAASIVAKVARDQWMLEWAHKDYPLYGFQKHVGYGTKLHRDMLQQHGICALHRLSYRPIQEIVRASRV
jgi:ribonuclease HII